MIRVAIVEDEEKCSDELKEYIAKYAEKSGETFNVATFADGLDFISDYVAEYDVIFMDIMMPNLNGMDAAKKLRELDKTVCLIFVTNMAQYAIKGYEVGAIDFMLKPIAYFDFAMKLEKAVYFSRNRGASVCIATELGMTRVRVSDVIYVQSDKHYIDFHTAAGVYRKRAALKEAEDALGGGNFARCNHSTLVNLDYVSGVEGNDVTVAGETLSISRSKKKEFTDKLTVYLGRSVI